MKNWCRRSLSFCFTRKIDIAYVTVNKITAVSLHAETQNARVVVFISLKVRLFSFYDATIIVISRVMLSMLAFQLLLLCFFCLFFHGERGALLEFQFWVKGISAFLFSSVDGMIFDCKVAIPYYKALIDSSLNLKNDKSNGNLISPLKSIKLKANAAFSQHSCTRY